MKFTHFNKQKYPYQLLLPSFFLLFILQINAQSNFHFVPPDNSYSDNLIIYNIAASLPQEVTTTFTINFPSQFSVLPDVAFGLSGYQGADWIYNQLFAFHIKNVSTSAFYIDGKPSTPTNIIYVKVSYLALQDNFNAMEIIQKDFTTFTSLSSSQIGPSIEQLIFKPGVSNINESWVCQFFINGFAVHSSDGFDLQLSSCFINSQKQILITAKVESTAYFQQINLLFLLIKKTYSDINSSSSASMYEYNYGEAILDSGNSDSGIRFNLLGIFMMGLSSFKNAESDITLNFDWEESQVVSLQIIFDFGFSYDSMVFSYFSLIKILCTNNFYWDSQARTCADSCPQAYTQSPINNLCQPCHSSCESCNESPTDCLSCHENFILLDGSCENVSKQQFSIYVLFSLFIIIPISLVVAYFLCCKNRNRIKPEDPKKMKEHPSIQL